jgi:hypothetical protein
MSLQIYVIYGQAYLLIGLKSSSAGSPCYLFNDESRYFSAVSRTSSPFANPFRGRLDLELGLNTDPLKLASVGAAFE